MFYHCDIDWESFEWTVQTETHVKSDLFTDIIIFYEDSSPLFHCTFKWEFTKKIKRKSFTPLKFTIFFQGTQKELFSRTQRLFTVQKSRKSTLYDSCSIFKAFWLWENWAKIMIFSEKPLTFLSVSHKKFWMASKDLNGSYGLVLLYFCGSFLALDCLGCDKKTLSKTIPQCQYSLCKYWRCIKRIEPQININTKCFWHCNVKM